MLPQKMTSVGLRWYRSACILLHCFVAGNNKKWEQTIHREGDRWGKTFNCLYHGTDKNPVLLVKYDDLQNDVVHEIKRMLDFLSYPYKGLLICIYTQRA